MDGLDTSQESMEDHGLNGISDQDEVIAEQVDDDDGGLFGDGSDEEGVRILEPSIKPRKLDDEELGSEDDEDRAHLNGDDLDGSGNEEIHERAQTILDVNIGRHAIPKPSDGELYLLQFPNFLGIDPKAFHHSNFQPPVTDHHSSEPPSSTFSSYQTSNNTVRWRYSPSKPSEVQSNSRIIRWSDGSITLQLASNPREQYELTAKPLAPSHNNFLKPTNSAANRGRAANGTPAYNSRLDSHTYLATPHEHASLIRITNHVTSSLAVQSSSDQNDDALVRLQQSLAAATKGNKTAADGGLEIISISEDPEQAKKRAEVAEKEKLRAQRRRQMQEERERDRANRVLGRSGLRTGGLGAGLTVGGLEDDDGMATTRARMTKPKSKSRRRNSEYSEEEDYRGMGRTREDEYDEDDGFLVRSDEEPELVPDESEEEAEMADDVDEEEEKPKKGISKRDVAVEAGEEVVAGGRVKRRRVIEDEDED
ncbi:hypothetical protein MMC22_001874 [Lobaria immixta]|nr:hypothetical protein [Lobaria immixta]